VFAIGAEPNERLSISNGCTMTNVGFVDLQPRSRKTAPGKAFAFRFAPHVGHPLLRWLVPKAVIGKRPSGVKVDIETANPCAFAEGLPFSTLV
jgi:hypothetical protein